MNENGELVSIEDDKKLVGHSIDSYLVLRSHL